MNVDARKITKVQMADMAWKLLAGPMAGQCPVRPDNKGVVWEVVVDRNRHRVRIYGNYMCVLDMTRQQLVAMSKYRGIYQ